jgi:hypothetical protein
MKSCLCSALSATNLPVADEIDFEVWTLPVCLQAAGEIIPACLLGCRRAIACAARWTSRVSERLQLMSLSAPDGVMQPDGKRNDEKNRNDDWQRHGVKGLTVIDIHL